MFEPIRNYTNLVTIKDFSDFLQQHCGFVLRKTLGSYAPYLGWLENDKTHIQLLKCSASVDSFWICIITDVSRKFREQTAAHIEWQTYPQYITGTIASIADSVIDKENRILIFPTGGIAWNY